MFESFLELVRKAAKKKILFLPHALDQMNWANRLISPKEVRKVIFQGEIIEEYPEDPRGHSCLMLGYGENKRAIHVVCSPNGVRIIKRGYNSWNVSIVNQKCKEEQRLIILTDMAIIFF